jgi:hypothetical protein
MFIRELLSERKLRLFGVAYCRFARQDPYYRDFCLFEPWAEQFADGKMKLEDAFEVAWESSAPGRDHGFRRLLTETPKKDVGYLLAMLGCSGMEEWFSRIIQCVAGNPFRPVTLDPACLTPTVKQLAESIYQERAFDRLPILADALVESGCQQEDVLKHLRGGGEHVRGCWALDLVTERE